MWRSWPVVDVQPMMVKQASIYTTMSSRAGILARDKAYNEICKLIRGGKLPPDEPLSERHLAEVLKIGRMPIREAMQTLASNGVLKVVPMRGTFVNRLSLSGLRDLYEVRRANEGLACYLAALKGASGDLLAFRGVFAKAADTEDREELIAIQREGPRFHEIIAETSGNAELVQILNRFRDKLELNMRIVQDYDLERIRMAAGEHLNILDALEKREPELARELMHDHLSRGYETRVRILGGIEIRGGP